MPIDITPEAVERLAYNLSDWGQHDEGLINDYRDDGATTLRALSASLTASQAETAAAYEAAADSLIECSVWCDSQKRVDDSWRNGVIDARKHHATRIRALTTADSKAALDRMIAEAEERGRNIGVATEKLGRLVEWLKEDEYNAFLLPADDVEKMRAILAAIPKGKDNE